MPRRTTIAVGDPLAVTLPALMRERQVTYRSLAARTRELDAHGGGITSGHLANIVSAHSRATLPVLELLAAALDVPPEHFAEYRLALMRQSLDEHAVGFDAAWRRYSELAD